MKNKKKRYDSKQKLIKIMKIYKVEEMSAKRIKKISIGKIIGLLTIIIIILFIIKTFIMPYISTFIIDPFFWAFICMFALMGSSATLCSKQLGKYPQINMILVGIVWLALDDRWCNIHYWFDLSHSSSIY